MMMVVMVMMMMVVMVMMMMMMTRPLCRPWQGGRLVQDGRNEICWPVRWYPGCQKEKRNNMGTLLENHSNCGTFG